MLEWLPDAAPSRPGAAWPKTTSPTMLMPGSPELLDEQALLTAIDDRTSHPAPAAQP